MITITVKLAAINLAYKILSRNLLSLLKDIIQHQDGHKGPK
jgi:hypothetical protein